MLHTACRLLSPHMALPSMAHGTTLTLAHRITGCNTTLGGDSLPLLCQSPLPWLHVPGSSVGGAKVRCRGPAGGVGCVGYPMAEA